MSKPRTIQEINNEYYQTAAVMGDLIHKAAKFTGDFPYEGQILEHNKKLNSIDREADLLQKADEAKIKSDESKALKENHKKEQAPQESAVM